MVSSDPSRVRRATNTAYQLASERASELEEQALCILAAAASLPIGTRRRPEFRYPSGGGESSEERERERERERQRQRRGRQENSPGLRKWVVEKERV